MNNGRRARSLRKAEESHQKNERTRNLENDGTGTVALFITESPKYRKVPNMGLQKSLSVPKHPGTIRVGEQASDNLPELDSVSRRTFQWSRMSPGELSGHFHEKQRSQRSPSTSQRSPSTSRHLENIEKIPVKVPKSSRGQRSSTEGDEPTIPHGAKESPKRMLGCTKSNRGPGDAKLRSEHFPLEVPNTPFQPQKQSGPETPLAAHTEPTDVPFLPTTSTSRAITFQGFLTTLTPSHEEDRSIWAQDHCTVGPTRSARKLFLLNFAIHSFAAAWRLSCQACEGVVPRCLSQLRVAETVNFGYDLREAVEMSLGWKSKKDEIQLGALTQMDCLLVGGSRLEAVER
ncbi:hypothetical protein CRG98_011107 [Punica granatum]|uniref:Uncharacterized protein n=1 Tax=Punica granatum TaxID=22663 RepID=A0A2I0KJ55_PUNGR|nr:hypothetical protein CRG98_011107 [Punica granatum]